MTKKVEILIILSKVEFQNFKGDIRSNMARKYDLKEMASKEDIKYMMMEITSLLVLNSHLQEEDRENKSTKSQSIQRTF
jgi:hypothetical protein